MKQNEIKLKSHIRETSCYENIPKGNTTEVYDKFATHRV